MSRLSSFSLYAEMRWSCYFSFKVFVSSSNSLASPSFSFNIMRSFLLNYLRPSSISIINSFFYASSFSFISVCITKSTGSSFLIRSVPFIYLSSCSSAVYRWFSSWMVLIFVDWSRRVTCSWANYPCVWSTFCFQTRKSSNSAFNFSCCSSVFGARSTDKPLFLFCRSSMWMAFSKSCFF